MIYTCPMHPQIEQDHPGNCSICGTTLEEKGVAQTVVEDHNPSFAGAAMSLSSVSVITNALRLRHRPI
jgi:hypothetical protein